MKRILVTGSAGFIGSALTLRLLEGGNEVIGVDNHNDYYDTTLKEDRLRRYEDHSNYTHIRLGIENRCGIEDLFKTNNFHTVVHLAAQAGVRYSIENPVAYIDSNLVGFANIIEGCAKSNVEHLIYASSSSVYGLNHKLPFSVEDRTDRPASLYAATKKSNEMIAHSYSHIYGLQTTGLRFFTVYGPWGRPDMALFKFVKSILDEKKIKLFNYGEHTRDFTYIDDVIDATMRVINNKCVKHANLKPLPNSVDANLTPCEVFNIGNSSPIELLKYVSLIEDALGKKALIDLLPFQRGDVLDTSAEMKEFENAFNFKAKVDITAGICEYVKWFKNYYQ